MHVPLSCQCGKQILVTEGSAGASVPCECGRTIQVPSLGEFRRRFGRDASLFARPERDPTRKRTGEAFNMGCGALVFLIGTGLYVGNATGVFPTLPCAGYIVTTVGILLFGVGAAARSERSKQDRSFRLGVEALLAEYREWSSTQALTGGRLVQYRGLDLVGAHDVPLAEVEREMERLLYEGQYVDWAEHQGRLYLRVWGYGDPEPDWLKVFAEQPL